MDFPQFRDIHHLIPQVLDLAVESMDTMAYHQIEDSDKWEIYFKYRKIVSRYLIEQTILWSNRQLEEHYVSLANYLLSSLSH